jgi:hypothetical protein
MRLYLSLLAVVSAMLVTFAPAANATSSFAEVLAKKVADNELSTNLRHFCRVRLEVIVEDCLSFEDWIKKNRIDCPIDDLREALDQTRENHKKGLTLDGAFVDKKSVLEEYISSETSKVIDGSSADENVSSTQSVQI